MYTRWLTIPAIFGVILTLLYVSSSFVVGVAEQKLYTTAIEFVYYGYGFFLSLWSMLFLIAWKRRAARLALQWGTLRQQETAVNRPSFVGTLGYNTITDEVEVQYESKMKYQMKVLSSMAILLVLILVAVGAVVLIFLLRSALQEMKDSEGNPSLSTNEQLIVVGVVNFIQIFVMDLLYRRIAVSLNNWENHRTDREYKDNLTLKVFIFKFMNNYNGLFIIAFIKPTLPANSSEACLPKDTNCSDELQAQLGSIILCRFLVLNGLEVLKPLCKQWLKRWRLRRMHGSSKAGKAAHMQDRHKAQSQRELQPYTDMVVFHYYAEVVLQFGFVTLFSVVFPIAATLAYISNIVSMKVGLYKILRLHRRPVPVSRENIGYDTKRRDAMNLYIRRAFPAFEPTYACYMCCVLCAVCGAAY